MENTLTFFVCFFPGKKKNPSHVTFIPSFFICLEEKIYNPAFRLLVWDYFAETTNVEAIRASHVKVHAVPLRVMAFLEMSSFPLVLRDSLLKLFS